MKVRYSSVALRQLDEIFDYISQDNLEAAHRVKSHIVNSIHALSQFPLLGRPTDKENVRVLSITRYPYITIYQTTEAEVIVIRIRHAARKPEE